MSSIGFLGTSAGIFSDISLLLEIIATIVITYGYLQARKHKSNQHHWLMITVIIVDLLFLVSYMVKSLIEGGTEFRGPSAVKLTVYLPTVIFHSIISIVIIIFAVIMIITAYKWNKKVKGKWKLGAEKGAKHRKYGLYFLIVWYISFITGMIVYLLLYVIYPQP